MSIHNICFHGEIRKIWCGYPFLSVVMSVGYVKWKGACEQTQNMWIQIILYMQSYLGICLPLKNFIVSNDSVSAKQRPRSDCADAQSRPRSDCADAVMAQIRLCRCTVTAQIRLCRCSHGPDQTVQMQSWPRSDCADAQSWPRSDCADAQSWPRSDCADAVMAQIRLCRCSHGPDQTVQMQSWPRSDCADAVWSRPLLSTHDLSVHFHLMVMIVSLFFPENRVWHFMQIVCNGDNLHKIMQGCKIPFARSHLWVNFKARRPRFSSFLVF